MAWRKEKLDDAKVLEIRAKIWKRKHLWNGSWRSSSKTYWISWTWNRLLSRVTQSKKDNGQVHLRVYPEHSKVQWERLLQPRTLAFYSSMVQDQLISNLCRPQLDEQRQGRRWWRYGIQWSNKQCRRCTTNFIRISTWNPYWTYNNW